MWRLDILLVFNCEAYFSEIDEVEYLRDEKTPFVRLIILMPIHIMGPLPQVKVIHPGNL